MIQSKTVIPVIVGPTACGKTEIAARVASKVNAEIVSADSRQVFKYMDIGTAKPTQAQRQAAVFHLIDFIDPQVRYSAGQFAEDGLKVIGDILKRKKLPLVVGGSGLYIKALFSPMFAGPKPSDEQREALDRQEKEKGLGFLFEQLREVDPAWAAKVGPNDRQRIKRGLEVYSASGRPISEWLKEKPAAPYAPLYLGVEIARPELYRRINERCLKMIDDGLIGEVKGLLDRGYSRDLNALNTVGYKEIIRYLDGKLGLDEAVRLAQQNTRNYAKRQLTWFRGLKNVLWLEPDEKKFLKVIKSEVIPRN